MAGGTEGFFHRLLCAYQHIGNPPHVPGDEHWLSYPGVFLWYIGVTGREGSGSALAMNTKFLLSTAYFVLFYLGDIVGYIIDKLQSSCRFTFAHYLAEGLPDPVGDALAVGPGIVGSAPHCGKVGLTFRRLYGSTGKLAVRQLNAIFRHCPHHFLNVVVGYLVSQAAGTAMYVEHYLPYLVYTHFIGDVRLIYFVYYSYLEKMISGA